jgi:hypothetical protein
MILFSWLMDVIGELAQLLGMACFRSFCAAPCPHLRSQNRTTPMSRCCACYDLSSSSTRVNARVGECLLDGHKHALLV